MASLGRESRRFCLDYRLLEFVRTKNQIYPVNAKESAIRKSDKDHIKTLRLTRQEGS